MLVKLNKRDFRYNACWFKIHKDEIDIEDMLRFSDNSVIGDDELYEVIFDKTLDRYVLIRGTKSGIVRLVEGNNLIFQYDFNVGDKIVVENDGLIYPTNVKWFVDNVNIPFDYIVRYHYNSVEKEDLNGEEFTVLYIDEKDNKVLIGNEPRGNVYLIDLKGVAKCE